MKQPMQGPVLCPCPLRLWSQTQAAVVPTTTAPALHKARLLGEGEGTLLLSSGFRGLRRTLPPQYQAFGGEVSQCEMHGKAAVTPLGQIKFDISHSPMKGPLPCP